MDGAHREQDLIDACRLILGQHHGVPWHEIPLEAVNSYLLQIRELKAQFQLPNP